MEYHHEVFCHEWIGVPDEGISEPCSTCGSVFEHLPKHASAHSHERAVHDEPVPDHVLDDPVVQANIAEAVAKVAEGRAKPGKTGRELQSHERARISTWAEREAMFTDPFEGCREDDR